MSLDIILNKLDKIVFADGYSKTWLYDSMSAVGSSEILERLGINETDFESEEEKEEEMLSAAEDWLYERSEEIADEFYDKAKFDGGLWIYRCMEIKDLSKFVNKLKNNKFETGYSGVGIYWSWNEDASECHWGKGGGITVTLVGRVPISAIDLQRTAYNNFSISTYSEDEITLKQGAKVEIMGIKTEDNKNFVDKIKNLKVSASQA